MKMAMHWLFTSISRQSKDPESANWAHLCISPPRKNKTTMISSTWRVSCRSTLQPWNLLSWSRRTFQRKSRRKYWRAIKDKKHLSSISREMCSGSRSWPLQRSPSQLADIGPGSRRRWAQRSSWKTGHSLLLLEWRRMDYSYHFDLERNSIIHIF